MSLIICPDCGSEVSTAAVACPKCGRPMSPPAFEERTVIREAAPIAVERDSFPKWIFIPLGLLGVILLFLLVMLFSQEKEDQANVSVNISSNKRLPSSNVNSSTRAEIETNQVVIPPSNVDSTVSNLPPMPSNPGTTTTTEIPADAAKVDRGNVNLEAKVNDRAGSPKPVKAEKFYLLDKDLDSILSDADIEPVNNQSLQNSFGISVVYPDKYSDVRTKSLAEIRKHIKYEVTTDASGKAQMKDVKPDGYYLFAITKTANGFAIWSSPVQVNAGQNNLSLSPPPMIETPEE